MTLPDDLAAATLALARRFAAGATLWSLAPRWPSHGRHVAVEFVHPVIVGKRALPAVHVDDTDPTASLRLLHRPGDVVLAIAPADDPTTAAVMRRAAAWGVTGFWIGAGPRPPAGAADHVLWAEGPEPADVVARNGGIVLLYHLLWELTHVVFEHPGLLADVDAEAEAEAGAATCTDDVCITCSDEGRLAEIMYPVEGSQALVLAGGAAETIDVSLVGEVVAGDLVLVHAGTAITLVDEGAPG